MAVGYNQWPTPKLLLTSDYSNEQHSIVASKYTNPLEVENFILAVPHSQPSYRQTYGWSREKLTNLMCVSQSVRQEAEVVLYQRFIFCFHYELYPKAVLRFLSEVSATALPNIRSLAFVHRSERPNCGRWTEWRTNCEVLSRHLTILRAVFFVVQAYDEAEVCPTHRAAACPGKLQATKDSAAELLLVAEPFTACRGVQVRWVGVDTGRRLGELCRVGLARGGLCYKSGKRPDTRDYYLMAFDL